MKIAIDAMGGDFAPGEIVRGSVEAVTAFPVEIILVGREEAIEPLLRQEGYRGEAISIIHAPEVIGMDEHPVNAIKEKKTASIVVATELVRDGKAQAVVSAGSTGAAMASALLRLGRIRGVERPAIGSPFPTLKGVSLLADAGANADCRPSHLVQFAHMGSVYAERVWGMPSPSVGLLNIGEEAAKGNELTQEVYGRLRGSGLNFIGNVEGRDVPAGKAQVVVCDGFVGNVVLKLAEGLAGALFAMMKEEYQAGLTARVGSALLLPGLRRIKRRMDYTEYGGAPLLGVNGVAIISHGSSNAKAIRNAIRVAKEAVEKDVVGTIARVLQEKSREKGEGKEDEK